MSLKNYTSEISVDRSISLIEGELVRAGAEHIAKSYADGQAAGITFAIQVDGQRILFRLMADVDKVEKILRVDRNPKVLGRPGVLENLQKQAARTAWKILYDWVTVEVARIRIRGVSPIEAFLAYVYDGKNDQTYFEKLKQQKYKALLGDGR